jgi:hypothetical protein
MIPQNLIALIYDLFLHGKDRLKHLNTVIGLAYPIFLANKISILVYENLKKGNFTAI